jgi:hypothetical protein
MEREAGGKGAWGGGGRVGRRRSMVRDRIVQLFCRKRVLRMCKSLNFEKEADLSWS